MQACAHAHVSLCVCLCVCARAGVCELVPEHSCFSVGEKP